MNVLSVCSGIGAAELAFERAGMRMVASADIEPFPNAVRAHHWPALPNWGDMTRYEEWPDADVDVLVGGTPCQSFSVAGLRKGLADERGNLALCYLEIARRYRPKWLVWENVPGVLSSNGGRDFGSILGGMGELGYGFAYRVLDAQFFGVAQRRRRVFVVGCLGDWRGAAAVLFERESLQGHPAPRREAGEGASASVIKGAAIGREPENGPQYGEWLTDGSCYTLNCTEQHAVAQCLAAGTGKRYDAETETLVAHSLRGEGFDASEDGTGRGTPLVAYAFNWRSGGDSRGLDPKPTAQLQRCQVPAVAFDLRGREGGAMPEGPHPTANLRAASGGSSRSYVAQTAAVRRLTPRECERLQGFPDDWTAVQHRGKPAADGPRYKALGNSMAVPVMEWIGRRLVMVDALMREPAA